jgi:hypothetical protein
MIPRPHPARIDFVGQRIDALELIGYDQETDPFPPAGTS